MDNSVIEVRDKDRKRFRVNYLVLGLFFDVVSQPCRLQLRHTLAWRLMLIWENEFNGRITKLWWRGSIHSSSR